DIIKFLDCIRGGIFIPFILRGQCLGCIVAIHRTPFEAQAIPRIKQLLVEWSDVWSFLSYAGLRLRQRELAQRRAQSMVSVLPRIATSVTDKTLLRKSCVALTSSWGLAWHRALVFRFIGSYPSDAVCVMGLGGLSGLTRARLLLCSGDAQEASTNSYPRRLA